MITISEDLGSHAGGILSTKESAALLIINNYLSVKIRKQ